MRKQAGVSVALVVCLLSFVFAASPDAQKNFSALDKLQGSSLPVALKFPKATLGNVLKVLSQAGGFQLEVKGTLSKDAITVDWENITLKEALVRLGKERSLEFEVPTPKKLVVILPKK